ncbi:DUF6414 family protein [Pseudactinotalea sp.]|uniref:DUF6414 family protein n=1 Tax=Pseudactinotalea sp. TaxID=1926260 RepID=UPI003B3B6B23
MPLRSPIYLDTETLLSHAEYNDIHMPHAAEIVETTRSKRSGGGKVGFSGIGAEGSIGNDVEVQSTYTLTPREKATVSRVIDDMVHQGIITTHPDDATAISRDDLVEIEGTTRITSASLAGKAFYILRKMAGDAIVIDDNAVGVDQLLAIKDVELGASEVLDEFKSVYLHNALLPVPILLQVTGDRLPCKVYANLSPHYFVDDASKDRIEGELRVLGTVSRIVDGGDDGYFSAEQWLLHDWEYMLRRFMMLDIDKQVADLVERIGLEQPLEDVHAYIKGPAIVVDVIALY